MPAGADLVYRIPHFDGRIGCVGVPRWPRLKERLDENSTQKQSGSIFKLYPKAKSNSNLSRLCFPSRRLSRPSLIVSILARNAVGGYIRPRARYCTPRVPSPYRPGSQVKVTTGMVMKATGVSWALNVPLSHVLTPRSVCDKDEDRSVDLAATTALAARECAPVTPLLSTSQRLIG